MPAFSVASDEKMVDLKVYVVCLDGVDAHEVDSVARVVDGISAAAYETNKITYWTGKYEQSGLMLEPVYEEIRINVTFTAVTDWDTYRNLIESGCDAIIANAHGETVPVPTNYSKEDFVDEIAYAMLHRNVTWVHMAGYPFYYFCHQEYGGGIWGEEGFQRFMSHMGKGNVTCEPPLGSEEDLVMMNDIARQQLGPGFDTDFAWKVDVGCPLKESDFNNYTILPIYSYGTYHTGAVIAFAKPEEESSFGLYVHLGIYRTHWGNRTPTNQDYCRGYIATAALYSPPP